MSNFITLIVEDDPDLRDAISETLEIENIEYEAVGSAEDAILQLNKTVFSLLITDVNLPGMSGMELLEQCVSQYFAMPVIVMTAYGSVDKAVEAMRIGAVDYLSKPFHPESLIEKIRRYAIPDSQEDDKNPIVKDSESLRLLALAKKVATTNSTVLIQGESGTGKEVMARYIHDCSNRSEGPFVAINCAAIPENMLEATLFGHEKGAFTGAHQSAPGKFELANHGTLLLDEISEMDLGLQAKLLRVIQEREVERIGGRKSIPLDVRILATTNRDLKKEVEHGRFREDLFYRLNVFPIKWLPLRDRKADIIPIAEHLLIKYLERFEKNGVQFSPSAKQKLIQYSWPGNVRELDNVIQRALIVQTGSFINDEDLLFLETEELNDSELDFEKDEGLNGDLKQREYQVILDTLKTFRGSRKNTAEKLGISQRTLRYKLAKMRDDGIDVREILSA